MTIGEKIKRIRILRKMTQQALAGERITRNMVSRMETGDVSPSLDTLLYLAMRLDVPAAYFLGEEDDPFLFLKEQKIRKIRDCYAKRQYARALKLLLSLPGEDDETAMLLSECHLSLGIEAVQNGSLLTARSHLQDALACAERTAYPTGRVRMLAPLYRAIAENVASPLLEFDEADYHRRWLALTDYEFSRYLLQDFSYIYNDPVLSGHMEAKKMLRAYRYQDAYALLRKLEGDAADAGYHAFVMFGVYGDLEQCCRQLGDFEGAYRYATKRASLSEGFKS